MKTNYQMLIVDDIEMNRAMLIKIFGKEYTVFSAENGREAMEVLDMHDIDIVLLDLSMPVMDGYEVITAMKGSQKLSAIPIVVTTGAVDKSERRAFDLGADDFVTKPYDPYIVKKRVDNLVQKYVLQLENLKQALTHAESLNKAKTEFFSKMSHEIRTPINSIISLSTLIEGNLANPIKVEELNQKIKSSSKYLLSVINDILDISAIEHQKIVITKSPFDFKRMVESISAMFYGQCNEKNIRFNMNLVNFTEEYLFGDPHRLKQILVNLISNAVKFTPNGGEINVRVSQISRVANMVKLRFEVEDNGEGIAEERQMQIFEPFEQETMDTVRNHGGSGLGLSIVKNIVELMGGTINVTSAKGQGSTFAADIPFTITRELNDVSLEKLKSVRALIIDDDRETQDYAKMVLSRMGITCDVAESGPEALEIMKKAFSESRGYDICFVDWRMPGMSGIEITRAIRTTFDDDTVIVVASAYDMGEIEKDAKMAGANVVVPKPMFQSTVFDLLMNISGGNYHENTENSVNYKFDGKRILLAEDNTLNAEVVMDLLHMVGFEIDRAVDGQEVCQMFDESEEGMYDAVLMDIQMPKMNGYEATRYIRESKHPQGKDIPIIAVTANAFTSDVRKSLEAGMNDHIAKPIDTERLYTSLDKLVGQN